MSLFGRHGEPRLVHLKSRSQAGAIILTWDVRGGRAARWRVLRSARGFADGPFDDTVVGSGQALVSDKPAPGARDDTPEREGACLYTVFVESERGEWRREAKVKLSADDPDLRRAESDFETSNAPSRPWGEKPTPQEVELGFRLDTMKSRSQREHPSVKTDDVD